MSEENPSPVLPEAPKTVLPEAPKTVLPEAPKPVVSAKPSVAPVAPRPISVGAPRVAQPVVAKEAPQSALSVAIDFAAAAVCVAFAILIVLDI